ncbi:MAG: hypothetical protein KDC03_19060, partial [Flavobacteriales bacterium]|nr:hypothetical protein [Flavobacteriales bacterium]
GDLRPALSGDRDALSIRPVAGSGHRTIHRGTGVLLKSLLAFHGSCPLLFGVASHRMELTHIRR